MYKQKNTLSIRPQSAISRHISSDPHHQWRATFARESNDLFSVVTLDVESS